MAGWLTAFSGLLVAVLAALLAYSNAQRLSQRQARLDRVNAQLEELYGPALALTTASHSAWLAFRAEFRPHGAYFDGRPSDAERDAWIAWMTVVFMPSNLKIRELIVSKTHLLDDDDMPAVLLSFLAHVAGYEVTTAAWESGDYSRLTSSVNHPGAAFDEYFRSSFGRLKKRQQDLLGTKNV